LEEKSTEAASESFEEGRQKLLIKYAPMKA
jgi:hypothetical protein